MKQLLPLIILLITLSACKETIQPTWQDESLPVDSRINALHFFNENQGWVVGGVRFFETLTQRTVDGGESWMGGTVAPVFDQILFDVDFLDENRGFATGIGGKILYTQDGGRSWETRQYGLWRPFHAITCISDSLIVAVGGNGYNSGLIIRSITGGGIWETVDTFDFELRDVFFTDIQTGYACGYGVILKTEDGGQSWNFTEAEDEFFSAIHFPEPQIGYAVGRTGSIVKTNDAGQTWEKLRNGNFVFGAPYRFNAVHFIDAQTGYVVGDKGLILKTVDGGDNWQIFEDYTQEDLQDIQVFAEGNFMVVGTNGTFLHIRE